MVHLTECLTNRIKTNISSKHLLKGTLLIFCLPHTHITWLNLTNGPSHFQHILEVNVLTYLKWDLKYIIINKAEVRTYFLKIVRFVSLILFISIGQWSVRRTNRQNKEANSYRTILSIKNKMIRSHKNQESHKTGDTLKNSNYRTILVEDKVTNILITNSLWFF